MFEAKDSSFCGFHRSIACFSRIAQCLNTLHFFSSIRPLVKPNAGRTECLSWNLNRNLQTMQNYSMSTTRALAIIGLLSALYIISAGLVSSLFGNLAKGYPEHFLRGILMTIVVISTGRKWSATIMGVVCGVVFAFAVGAPAPYVLASTIVSGLVYDLALMGKGPYSKIIKSAWRITLGSVVSGLAESLVALSILTLAGVLNGIFYAIAAAWETDIALNLVLSGLGAVVGIRIIRQRLRKTSLATDKPDS
jgi:hypothetical protein